jgi:hexosaminidase
MKTKHLAMITLLSLSVSTFAPAATTKAATFPNLVPWPKKITIGAAHLKLRRNLMIAAASPALAPLATILANELNAIAGLHATVSQSAAQSQILLRLVPTMKDESYGLAVDDKIVVTGKTYESVAEGSVTLLQAMASAQAAASPTAAVTDEIAVPKMNITDQADTSYRGLMIDLAREFHPAEDLKLLIEMCRFYKIRYLHLHLSDDQSFTFPSQAYPQLATSGRSYSRDEMQDLVKFADDRAVTIVPEIDMPGHASAIVSALPELKSAAGNIINFANPKCVEIACTLVDELAEMFPKSPYIHIGGDEANLGPLVNDPAFVQAIADANVHDVDGLFNHFLNQLDERVKSHHKRTITWEGFSIQPDGPGRVQPDVIVEPFDNYRNAQEVYIADGHDLINTSWFPMYVLRDALFGTKSIYDWDLYTFGNYRSAAPRNYEDVTQYKVTKQDKVLGAQVCSWEQGPATEIPTLRRRLATMSERVWNRSSGQSYANFTERLSATDSVLSALLTTKAPGEVAAAATNAVYADRIEVQWTVPSEYPSTYTVLRGISDDASAAEPIAMDIRSTHFTDREAAEGNQYHYGVKAKNHFGEGALGKPAIGSLGTSTNIVSAYEGFADASGSTLAGVSDGTGWAGPWEVAKEEAAVTFKPEGLTYSGLKTTGGCLNIKFSRDKDMVDVHRPTVGIQGVPGTQMWVSYLIRPIKIGDGHFLAVSDASSNVAIGKEWGNGLCIYGYATNIALEVGKTYLLVARFDCMSEHDIVHLWVNPSLDKEPDVDAPGVAIDPDASASSGTKFGFSSQGYGSGEYDFDELRLGATWRDVMPRQ